MPSETHDSQDTADTDDTPASEAINIPGEFPASFTVEEFIEFANEQNWEFIGFDIAETHATPLWNFTYQTRDGVMILVTSNSTDDGDGPRDRVSVIGKRIHYTDCDVQETPIQRMSTVPGRRLKIELPKTIAEQIDYTPGEPLSESQFNDLFNGTGWGDDSDTTLDWLSGRPMSKQPLSEATFEDIKHTVTVIEDIRAHNKSTSELTE